ncbi:MAG: DUF296 domain-containing protein [Clostridia bacterium]|nr:DUF296 domain-containing protein [Clostridia bacterium]
MDYRKYGDTFYIRMDKGDEIIENIIKICEKEKISSATFSGIGGCSKAEIQTFVPNSGTFMTNTVSGMLELVSLTGNVIKGEDNQLYHHTHAVFSYKDGESHTIAAGHIKSITVLYTAEIELRPVKDGEIGRRFDPVTKTGFWDFKL